MKIVVRLEPATESPPDVSYRWDADTDILSAQLPANGTGDGMSGSVGLEGTDGSWLILDVADGRINGVEVAVWPDVRNIAGFALPSNVENARVVVPSRTSQPSIASLEMATRLAQLHAEALDFTHAKALADKTVDVDVPHGHLSAGFTGLQPDLLDNFG